MKKLYEIPSAELLALQSEDIMTLSLLGYEFDDASKDHIHDANQILT